MKADVLRQNRTTPDPVIESNGNWTYNQDTETGEIIRLWQPTDLTDDPQTPQNEGLQTFRCLARGIIDGGIRVSGTTERFSEMYENVDYVKITFPASVILSKRDRVTNIRDGKNNIIWKEEEQIGSPPTVFNVMGVTPVIDPFGRHIENQALLERAEVQR